MQTIEKPIRKSGGVNYREKLRAEEGARFKSSRTIRDMRLKRARERREREEIRKSLLAILFSLKAQKDMGEFS